MAKQSKKQLSAIGSKIVQAFGHPIRARALMILGNRVASPREIAEEIGEPLGKVSYHIRELRNSGLIELVDTDGRHGGVQHFYRASRMAVMDKDGMAALDAAERAASSAVVINLLVSDLATAVAEGTLDARTERVLIRHHALVDKRGWDELSDLYTETLFRAFDIHRESLARIEESGEEGMMAAIHSLIFEMPDSEEAMGQTLEWLDGREAEIQSGGGSEGRGADEGGPAR